MAISETQLETWSHQGAIAQSRDTYATIKRTLEDTQARYNNRQFHIFLQGSYCNDTNVYRESDVDVVIRLTSTFYHDLTALPPDQQTAFHAAHSDSPYSVLDFSADVLAHLQGCFAEDVVAGDKAIQIASRGNRRKADVLVSAEFRRYYKFNGIFDQSYDEGVCFFNRARDRIANYPRQHSENLTAKHQATNAWFKPTMRILKNMRNALVADGALDSGTAPSYYLEGLLYNVPNTYFGRNYVSTVAGCLNWILQADRSQFVCANQQYYLLREDPHVTWAAVRCQEFLDRIVELWDGS